MQLGHHDIFLHDLIGYNWVPDAGLGNYLHGEQIVNKEHGIKIQLSLAILTGP